MCVLPGHPVKIDHTCPPDVIMTRGGKYQRVIDYNEFSLYGYKILASSKYNLRESSRVSPKVCICYMTYEGVQWMFCNSPIGSLKTELDIDSLINACQQNMGPCILLADNVETKRWSNKLKHNGWILENDLWMLNARYPSSKL